MRDLDITILVNKNNKLPSSYVPKELIITDNNENNFHNYKDPNLKPMVRKDIFPYILRMFTAAKRAGLEIIVDSGYRDYHYQQVVLDALIKEKGDLAYQLVALPGASEHQTGLAIDVAYFKDGIYIDDVKESDVEAQWLYNNAYKYGFILRYPKGKEDITGFSYEPWHFRFVGLELAQELFVNNLTLEEYYELKIKR